MLTSQTAIPVHPGLVGKGQFQSMDFVAIAEEEAEFEGASLAGTRPSLAAVWQSAIELISQGFNGSATAGSTGLLHLPIMDDDRPNSPEGM